MPEGSTIVFAWSAAPVLLAATETAILEFSASFVIIPLVIGPPLISLVSWSAYLTSKGDFLHVIIGVHST